MAKTYYHLKLNLGESNEREAWRILQSKRHTSRTTFLVETLSQPCRRKQKEDWLQTLLRAEPGRLPLACRPRTADLRDETTSPV